MPRARETSWRELPLPTHEGRRGAFLDKCAEWYASEPTSEHERSFDAKQRTRWKTTHTAPRASIGLSMLELRLHAQKPCCACEAEDGSRAIMANPFAPRGLVLVCESCHSAFENVARC